MLPCEFEPAGSRGIQCRRCGRLVPLQIDPSTCHAECPASCAHLGDRVGEILVECQSCQGRVRLKFASHACAAFGENGRCLPAYVPTDLAAWAERKPESEIYHLCRRCPSFTPAAAT